MSPTPQRLLSTLGLGNSLECVEPGRGLPGRRPKPLVEKLGQPPPSFLSRPNIDPIPKALLLEALLVLLLLATGLSTAAPSLAPSTADPISAASPPKPGVLVNELPLFLAPIIVAAESKPGSPWSWRGIL